MRVDLWKIGVTIYATGIALVVRDKIKPQPPMPLPVEDQLDIAIHTREISS